MNKIFQILTATLASQLAVAFLSAQTLSAVQQRQFNLDVLRTLENYESSSALYGNAARMDFEMLFESPSMHIFNDLNGLSAAPTLSVADYSELLSSKGRSTQVIIKQIKKGDPYYEEGWKMDVSFEKEITYANACEILFSSRNYFGSDFHIEMTLLWDEDMRTCTISKLEGQNTSEIEMLPQEYGILTHTSDRDYIVRVDGDSLRFNSFGQAFLSPNPIIEYPDNDVRVKAVVENAECNTISLQYLPKRWRTKVHYDMNLGGFYNGDGKAESESSGTEFCLDIGYFFPSKNTVKWGVFTGLGFSLSKIDMAVKNLSYNYQASASADIDGDSYTRYYSISGMSQTLKSTDFMIPVYLEMDVRNTKSFSLYFDAGIKTYLNLSNSTTINSCSYSTYGYYDQYGIFLRPEDRWDNGPINGFTTNSSITGSHGSANYKRFSVDVLGRIGLRFLVYKDIFFDLGASYQMSVLSPFDSDAKVSISGKDSSENNALMSYQVATGEVVRGLDGSYSSLGRNTLLLNIGLVYRF